MIRGHKPSAYGQTYDGESGKRIEVEFRQCCHCQFSWEYRPGSGDRRGWCFKHNGFLCARPECVAQQLQLISQHLGRTGKLVSCLAFEEWNDGLMEAVAKTTGKLGQDFSVTPAGLIVPV